MDTIKNLNPLIDLDPFSYSCGFAADSQIRKEAMEKGASKEEAARIIEETDYIANALANARTAVDFILEQCFPERTYYEAYLTGKGNYRNTVATIKPYKGNRDPTHKPKYFKDIREYFVNKYGAIVVEGQEADDALGIKQFSNPDKSTVICSIDKDLKMIPGYHYNPSTGNFWYQTMDEANMFFWWQMMVGDTTDNIPGINKVGPKTADKIIAECNGDIGLVEQRVREMYAKQYPDYPGAISEVAELLWMRRREGEGPNV